MSDTPDSDDPQSKGKRKPKPAVAPVVSLEEARAARASGKWQQLLRLQQGGAPTKDIGNLVLLLINDPEWSGCLAFDEFSERVRWTKSPPALPGLPLPSGEARRHHALYVHHYFARLRGVSFAKNDVWEAMSAAAHARPTHAVREWLKSLAWDGTKRVETWLSEYFGAEDTPLNRAIGRMWLVSAVARVMEPGCQADHMLVLQAVQGAGKSTGLEILFGKAWYLPKLPNIQDETRAASALRGRWGVEVGELDAFRGAASTRIKDFLSQRDDDFRAAYAEHEIKRPRHCIFAGSTNENAFLGDPTGARRFWCVRVGLVDRLGLKRDRELVWAEALAMYESGVHWWPERADSELLAALSESQEERFVVDDWETRIATWLGSQLQRDGFTSADVLAAALSMAPGQWDKSAQTRVGHILTRLGYERHRVLEGKVRLYRYWRPGER